MPEIVRCNGDIVYVWSAMSLRFIVYDLEGTPLGEYRYRSAITDFIPTDDFIYIYTAGLAAENVIEKYSLARKKKVASFYPSDNEHQALLHSWAAVPFYAKDDVIHFSTKNRMQPISLSQDVLSFGEEVKSETFHVERVRSIEAFEESERGRRRYLRENSQVLCMIPDETGGHYLVTLEGTTKVVNNEYDLSGRIICVYHTTKSQIRRYRYDSFGTQLLFHVSGSSLYYLSREVEGENETYTLKRVNLQPN